MERGSGDAAEAPYSLGAAVRATGLSAHTIRAWERRYGAVRPRRTPGGTRRYSEEEVERLQLLAAAVDAGHRISDVARLDEAALRRLAQGGGRAPDTGRLRERLLEAVERLDAAEVEALLAMQFQALGPARFARDVAAPALRELGERWEHGRSSPAEEHLASAVLRGFLGAALQSGSRPSGRPRILFTTPAGERHEFGALIAAVAASGPGAEAVYLGPDLPAADAARAAERLQASAIALSAVSLPEDALAPYLAELRARLPESVKIWLGGAAAGGHVPGPGVEPLRDLDQLEERVRQLSVAR